MRDELMMNDVEMRVGLSDRMIGGDGDPCWALVGWLADGVEPRQHTLDQAAAVALSMRVEALDMPALQGQPDLITIVLDAPEPAAVIV